jgi:hypothetical protein
MGIFTSLLKDAIWKIINVVAGSIMAYLKAFQWESEEWNKNVLGHNIQLQCRYSIARPHKYEIQIRCQTQNALKTWQECRPLYHDVR